MRWFRIPKENAVQPEKGGYSDWKPKLAEEAEYQCVYCAIHESNFGGIRNFHVEHFRPKSNSRFSHLIDDFTNLYYSCSICNCFKGNDWPSDPPANKGDNVIHYPEPSSVDYSILFKQEIDSKLIGETLAGKYLVQKLYLNRPQLILERRSHGLMVAMKMEARKLQAMVKRVEKSDISEAEKREFYKICINLLTDATTLLAQGDSVRPYSESDIRR